MNELNNQLQKIVDSLSIDDPNLYLPPVFKALNAQRRHDYLSMAIAINEYLTKFN